MSERERERVSERERERIVRKSFKEKRIFAIQCENGLSVEN